MVLMAGHMEIPLILMGSYGRLQSSNGGSLAMEKLEAKCRLAYHVANINDVVNVIYSR